MQIYRNPQLQTTKHFHHIMQACNKHSIVDTLISHRTSVLLFYFVLKLLVYIH